MLGCLLRGTREICSTAGQDPLSHASEASAPEVWASPLMCVEHKPGQYRMSVGALQEALLSFFVPATASRDASQATAEAVNDTGEAESAQSIPLAERFSSLSLILSGISKTLGNLNRN